MVPRWWKQQPQHEYKPAAIEDADTLLEEGQLPNRLSVSSGFYMNGRWLFLTTLNLLILGAAILIVCTSNLYNEVLLKNHDVNAAVRENDWYTPVYDSMEISFKEIQFNGTIWPGPNPFWARKAPSDEVDQIWRSQFDPIWAIPITSSDVLKLGKDPSVVAKFEDDFWGLGDDAYIGALDVVHQMHCLNAIREYAFADYAEDRESPTKKRHGDMQWLHLQHCVDIIAQNVMCHADAGIHTYNWMDTQRQPFPDFSVNRKCRDWDALMAWRDERVVDMEKYRRMQKPKGVKQVPAEPGYYERYGYEDSDLYPELARQAEEAKRLKQAELQVAR